MDPRAQEDTADKEVFMGWQQRFQRCHDKLMLRVGGPGGPLIHWPDRGQQGQCTWCWDDPSGETRDISAWVGDGPHVRLYALIIETGATGGYGCTMETLHDGAVCKAWAFDGDEDHEVHRQRADAHRPNGQGE